VEESVGREEGSRKRSELDSRYLQYQTVGTKKKEQKTV
jgi:hypothetical protein